MNVNTCGPQTIEISLHEFRKAFFQNRSMTYLHSKLQGTGMSLDEMRKLYHEKGLQKDQPIGIGLDNHRWHNYVIKLV